MYAFIKNLLSIVLTFLALSIMLSCMGTPQAKEESPPVPPEGNVENPPVPPEGNGAPPVSPKPSRKLPSVPSPKKEIPSATAQPGGGKGGMNIGKPAPPPPPPPPPPGAGPKQKQPENPLAPVKPVAGKKKEELPKKPVQPGGINPEDIGKVKLKKAAKPEGPGASFSLTEEEKRRLDRRGSLEGGWEALEKEYEGQLTTAVRNRNEYEEAKARVYLGYIKPHIEEDLGEW